MNDRTKAALIGGLVAGIPSALPIISICCILWALGGGFLAVFIYMRGATAAPMSPGDGAKLGVKAGIIGAIAYVVIALPVTLLTGAAQVALQQAGGESAGLAGMAAGLGAFAVVVGAGLVFGLTVLGGVIGAAVLGKGRPGGAGSSPPPPPSDFGGTGGTGYGGTGTGGSDYGTGGGGYGGTGGGYGGTTGGTGGGTTGGGTTGGGTTGGGSTYGSGS
jgi:hypothetical protein